MVTGVSTPTAVADRSDVAPGSVVVVRDEEWLVTGVTTATDGQLLDVQELSDLVSGTTAYFYSALDWSPSLYKGSETFGGDESPRPHLECVVNASQARP